MSANLRLRCKGTKKNVYVQEKMPFMRNLHKWQGYNAILICRATVSLRINYKL